MDENVPSDVGHAGERGPESKQVAPAPRVPSVRALVRESARVRRLLASGAWGLSPVDAEAVGDVLARVVAPLPGRVRARDRDRRLQRVFRTTVHHLDAGEVSPSLAALLAAVARALVPWHAYPNAPRAAAAPRYGDATEPPPTEAGEALLADPAELFTALMATSGRHAVPLTPPVEPWRAHHVGRFRRCTRPAPGVWAAETIRCPECGGKDGPWTVDCDWRRAALGCPCGAVHREHGLALSEIWLALAES